MFFRRSRSSGPRRRALSLTGALGAALALLLATPQVAASATGAPAGSGANGERAGAAGGSPGVGSVEPGEAYMGVGIEIHEGGEAGESGGPEPATPQPLQDTPQGIDVSNWQGAIDWGAVRSAGIEFAWMKATEGTTFRDARFATNYPAAHGAGVIRGAYHFALPNASSGAAQANFFADNGGAWSADNLTLPGVLDIEHNPYGAQCYGLTQAQMQNWIADFHATYKARTSRDVVIYTTASWWDTCTGGWSGLSAHSPLWVAHWTSAASPTIPNGFPTWTAWQYTDSGSVSGISGPVDRNRFNGSRDRLLALANNTP